MYHKILVPIAFDDERDRDDILAVVKTLAAEDAEVTFLHVIERVPGYALSYIPEDLLRETRAAITHALDALADQVPNGKGVVVDGHAGRTILDYAGTNEPDLIIVSSHRPGMQDLLLGSTASQVVRHAACAVHILR